MRIVIDLQAAQGTQRFEQSGSSALALAMALARLRGEHDIIVALNGLLGDAVEPIRAAFDGLLPQSHIRIWYGSHNVAAAAPARSRGRAMAEQVREAFLASLGADAVLVMNMFEGFDDDAVVSIGSFTPTPLTAVLLHDLRALRDPAMVLAGVAGKPAFYANQAVHLQGADLLLAMSAQSAADASELLGKPATDLSAGLAALPGQAHWDAMATRVLAALQELRGAHAEPAPPAQDLLASLIDRLPRTLGSSEDESALRQWAHFLSHFPQPDAPAQLLVDISELVQRDARTGVQRVTRSILQQLLDNPPAGYQVCPVYCTGHAAGYRYARRFTAAFQGLPVRGEDEPIDYQHRDVFLGLDLLPHLVPYQKRFLERLRADGVRVVFVVYDLLPVLMPQQFPPGTEQGHAAWLDTILGFDGVVCISRAVAEELAQWAGRRRPARLRPIEIGWFHLGADVDNSKPSRGMPPDAGRVLATLERRPTLLAVGTVEPRKQYAQILAAFERLWAAGTEVNLVIVGKEGWMVSELAASLRHHAELGRRLFWLEGISDEYLASVYAAAKGLIAASAGEGFGLPLIEAAQHGLPIIARDLPVFREVGGEHALYFSGFEGQDLADAITDWLELREQGRAPSTAGLAWLSWAQSARQLMQVVLGQAERASQMLPASVPVKPSRPRVLSLAPYPVRRPRHGGQLRVAAMNRVYEAAGFDMHCVGFYQSEAYEEADIGPYDIPFPPDSPFRNYLGMPMPSLSDFLMGPFSTHGDSVFRQVVEALPGRIDVIQVEQPWLAGLARWLLLQAPQCRDALLVYSSHNIEAEMKRAILAPLYRDAVIDHVVADMATVENELAREAALSLAVTASDAAALGRCGAATVLLAPNGISPWQDDPERQAAWRARLPHKPWPVFIASAHPPNFTGFIDAIGDSLDCIPEGSKLVICGGVGAILERELAKSPAGERNLARLQVLGVLDDADLAAVKSLAHVFLLPIGAGGGSNIKTAEALYSGKPVIGTSTALRGFERFANLPEVTVADTPANFQAAIRRVLDGGAPPGSAESAAMRESVTWDACLAEVPRAVASMLASRREDA